MDRAFLRLANCNEIFAAMGRPYLRYFAKHGKSNVGGVARSGEELATVIANLGPEWDVYLTLNHTKDKGPLKARAVDIQTWEYVLIDVDPLDGRADPHRAMVDALCHADKLVGNATNSCHVIASGRGVQAWLRVAPVAIQSDEDRRAIDRSCAAFLRAIDDVSHGCRVDTSCSDLGRVARCPGSVNSKSGLTATLIHTAKEVVNPQFILDLCPKDDIVQLPPSGLPLPELLPYLTARAATFLTQGVITPGRHAAAYAAAISLQEAGVTEADAKALVMRGALYCTPPLPVREAFKATHNAYRKGL